MLKGKKFVLILSIIFVIVILLSSSFALLFKEDSTGQQSYKSGLLSITSSSSNGVTLTDAVPMSDADGATSTPYTFTITNNGNVNATFDVLLLSTTSSNQIDSQYIKIKVNDNDPITLNTLTQGEFLSDQYLMPSQSMQVTIRVWLASNTPNTQIGKTFTGKIVTNAYSTDADAVLLDDSGANAPDLVDGLIPVYYNGTNWAKADSMNILSSYKWYDYGDKMWANAVLVTETNRSTYQNALAGTTIANSDILAFYVWIPRFKYRVWNINKVIGTDSYDAQTTGIDIIFENGTASTGTVSCTYDFTVTDGSLSETCTGSNGDYYTHPAFTLGSDELRGFWIGKFELSELDGWTDYTNYGKGNATTPTVLPNVTSWRYSTVSIYWNKIYNMQASGNIYGLSTSRANTDSHMITNMEWGAVAYLTYSDYGVCTDDTCTEISVNRVWDNSDGQDAYSTYYTTKTGCGVDGTTVSSTCYAYNTATGMLTSTTANIYGVYDIAGGAREYLMSNMSSAAGSYTYYVKSAGSSYTYTGYEKYVTTYAYGASTYTDQTAYNRTRLGDATGEIIATSGKGWNNDTVNIAYGTNPWITRGGYFNAGAGAGLYNHNYGTGAAGKYTTTRNILLSMSS